MSFCSGLMYRRLIPAVQGISDYETSCDLSEDGLLRAGGMRPAAAGAQIKPTAARPCPDLIK